MTQTCTDLFRERERAGERERMHASVLSFFAIPSSFTWAVVCVFYLHSGHANMPSVGHLPVHVSVGI